MSGAKYKGTIKGIERTNHISSALEFIRSYLDGIEEQVVPLIKCP